MKAKLRLTVDVEVETNGAAITDLKTGLYNAAVAMCDRSDLDNPLEAAGATVLADEITVEYLP